MKLSILIPSRNEMYLQRTIDDLLEHAEGDIEVIVGFDGWATTISGDERLRWHDEPVSIGQRAMTNKLAAMATGDYFMKTDAHCSFSQRFDVELLKLIEPDMTMAPVLCRLNAEEWHVKAKPRCVCYRFDKDLIFDYWHEREEGHDEDLVDTLALQGSCFVLHRDKYFELDICGEEFGSWGQQGVEVALKTWLSGGRVVTNRNAYYGHMFRGPDDFPYERDMKQIEHAKDYCKELFLNDAWPKATRTLKSVIDQFAPVPGWHVINSSDAVE